MQSLVALPSGGNYFDGYQVRQVTPNSVQITRQYVPIWAIVVAIVGVLLCFLGLLFLLVRQSEVLTITVTEREEGSYLEFSGTAGPAVATAVNLAIDRLLNGAAATSPTSPSAAQPVPPEDGKTCPACAETVRAAAQVCRFCGYQFSAASGRDGSTSAVGDSPSREGPGPRDSGTDGGGDQGAGSEGAG